MKKEEIKQVAHDYLANRFPNLIEQHEHENQHYGLSAQIGACDIFIEKLDREPNHTMKEILSNFNCIEGYEPLVLARIRQEVISFRTELANKLINIINNDSQLASTYTMSQLLFKQFDVLLIRESRAGVVSSEAVGLAQYLFEMKEFAVKAIERIKDKSGISQELMSFYAGAPIGELSFDAMIDLALIIERARPQNAAADIELLGFRTY